MSALASIKDFIPFFDLENEAIRWNQVYKVITEPKPEIEFSPRECIWKKNKAKLWFYPAKEKKFSIPLFFVYSLLNKPYILDIGEGSSVIGGLTDRGYDVYLLDWGSPSHEDNGISLDNYIIDYLENALKRAIRHSGVEEITFSGLLPWRHNCCNPGLHYRVTNQKSSTCNSSN